MEFNHPKTAAARENLGSSANWKTESAESKAVDDVPADRFADDIVSPAKRVTSFKDLDHDDQEEAAAQARLEQANRAMITGDEPLQMMSSREMMPMTSNLASVDPFSAFSKAGGFPGAGLIDPTSKQAPLGGFESTTVMAPRPTAKASPERPIANPKELAGEYYRPYAILISPNEMETPKLAQKIFERCHDTIKAVGGYAISETRKFRLRGNLEYGYEATKFELQVHRLVAGGSKDGQLAVNVQHLSHNGRSAFFMLLQKVAWDLKEAKLAEKMADGTDILRPMCDLLAASSTEDEYTSSDELDDLSPPSMLGTLGLSSVVTNRKSGKRRPSGIRLEKDENNDLVRLWSNMIDGRERHEILKTIAHCSEDESNAKKIGESDDLIKQIIEVLGTVGIHGERDQQSIHCALAIIENVLKLMRNVAEFMIKTKILELLVENLLFYLGLSAKTAHVRSETIQDAAVASLNFLVVEWPKSSDDGSVGCVVTSDTMKKLEKVMQNKTKIRNKMSQDNLTRVYERLKTSSTSVM